MGERPQQSYYLTLRHTVSARPPETPEAVSVVFNSSPETETATLCSRPVAVGFSAPSVFLISILPDSSTDHSPNWATSPLAADASSSTEAPSRDFADHFCGHVPFGLALKIGFFAPSAETVAQALPDRDSPVASFDDVVDGCGVREL